MAGAAKLKDLSVPERKAQAQDIFHTSVRQFHAGVVVTLAGPDKAKTVTGKVSGLPKPIVLGKYDMLSGDAEVADALAIRAATSAAAGAVSRLPEKSTLPQAQTTFETAFKGRIRSAQLTFEGADAQATVKYRKSKDEMQTLGVIMNKAASAFQSMGRRGAQELLRHKASGQEFVRAAGDMTVQRYIWRALSDREGTLMTNKYEQVDNTLSLPPRPAAPGHERDKKATTIEKHASNAVVASDFLSATTIEDARIANRRSGQPFRGQAGTIKIDLFQIDPGAIFVGSSGGKPNWGFSDPKNKEAGLDVVATREVFLKGGVPAAAIVEWKKGP
jgi:hypothetical protein